MDRNKIIYWAATGLLCLLMLASAGMYLFNYEGVVTVFGILGFPSYIIYPLAVAKIWGVLAILSRKSEFLKEWAYAGFFFDFLLAGSAHLNVGDGQAGPALFALVLLFFSYTFEKYR